MQDPSVLKHGLNDSFILLVSLLCECDVYVEIRECAVELVVVRGGELQSEALGDQEGEQRVLTLVAEEVRVVAEGLRLVFFLDGGEVPDKGENILILDRHKAI